jgi:hypothetical protein
MADYCDTEATVSKSQSRHSKKHHKRSTSNSQAKKKQKQSHAEAETQGPSTPEPRRKATAHQPLDVPAPFSSDEESEKGSDEGSDTSEKLSPSLASQLTSIAGHPGQSKPDGATSSYSSGSSQRSRSATTQDYRRDLNRGNRQTKRRLIDPDVEVATQSTSSSTDSDSSSSDSSSSDSETTSDHEDSSIRITYAGSFIADGWMIVPEVDGLILYTDRNFDEPMGKVKMLKAFEKKAEHTLIKAKGHVMLGIDLVASTGDIEVLMDFAKMCVDKFREDHRDLPQVCAIMLLGWVSCDLGWVFCFIVCIASYMLL